MELIWSSAGATYSLSLEQDWQARQFGSPQDAERALRAVLPLSGLCPVALRGLLRCAGAGAVAVQVGLEALIEEAAWQLHAGRLAFKGGANVIRVKSPLLEQARPRQHADYVDRYRFTYRNSVQPNVSDTPHWSGSDKSGVTIGPGYNLGAVTSKPRLRAFLTSKLGLKDAEAVAVLVEAAGRQGAAARNYLVAHRAVLKRIRLSSTQEKAIFREIAPAYEATAAKYVRAKHKREWERLSPAQQEILFDYQYNPGLGLFPKFVAAVLREDWDAALRDYVRYATQNGSKLRLGRRNEEMQALLEALRSARQPPEERQLTARGASNTVSKPDGSKPAPRSAPRPAPAPPQEKPPPAAAPRPVPKSPECVALAAAIDKLNRAGVRAALADDVYKPYDPKDPLPAPGITRISGDKEKMRELFPGMSDEDLADLTDPKNSSYRAAIYQGPNDKTFLVFRGTENAEGLSDWKENGLQGAGMQSEHYQRAKHLGDMLSDRVGTENLEIVGHSKGGGMAAATAMTTGAKATTFNPAGVHPNTVGGADVLAAGGRQIDTYVVEGEVLNWVQDNRNVVKGGLVGAATTVSGGLAGLGTAILTKDALPPANGRRVDLPAVWEEGKEPSWYDPVGYRVTLHGMEKVKAGLGKKCADALADYNSSDCAAQTGPRRCTCC